MIEIGYVAYRKNNDMAEAPKPEAVLSTAFSKFMESDGKKLAADSKPDAVLKGFKEWAAKADNKDATDLNASRQLETLAADKLAAPFKSAKRNEVIDKAMDSFLKSPEGVALLQTTPDAKGVFTKFESWVETNAKQGPDPKVAPNAEAVAAAAALAESKAAPSMDIDRVNGVFAAAKKGKGTGPAAEEESMLGKNKGGLIGALIMGILGFLLGGPIGALLGAGLGFAGGNMAVDGQGGFLSNLLNPEPPSAKIAKPFGKRGGNQNDKSILLNEAGEATQKFADAKRAVAGHFEGKGENRKFVITGVGILDEANRERASQKLPMVFQPASGVLSVTKGGNIDVTGDNAAVLASANDMADKGARDDMLAVREETGRHRNQELLNSVGVLNDGQPTDAKQALAGVQAGWEKRLEQLKVGPDRREIARIITEKYADPAFRDKPAAEQLAEIKNADMAGGRKVGAALEEERNGGLGDKKNGGPSGVEFFDAAFTTTAKGVADMLNDTSRGVKGKAIELPPQTPAIVGSMDAAKAAADLAKAKPKPAAAAAMPDQEVALQTTKDVPVPSVVVPGADVTVLGKAMSEVCADEDKKRFMDVKLGGAEVTLVGSLNDDGKFVADTMITKDGIQIAKDISGLDESKRTFDAKDNKVAIGSAGDTNRATMDALVAAQAAADTKTAKTMPKTAGRTV